MNIYYLFFISSLNSRLMLCSDEEKDLIEKLLKNYNSHARPVAKESSQLKLEIILTLKQIINLDVRKQILKTKLWMEYYWKDKSLVWKPENNGNITSIRIPSHKIWNPDILMYNSASKGFDSTYKVNIIVYNDGSCKYGPPGIFTSTCQIDITWFPFDEQNCTMKFGSWTYKLDALNIIGNKTDQKIQRSITGQEDDGFSKDLFEESGEWVILGVPATRTETNFTYNNQPETYVDITYTIMMRRRTLYYFSYLILPCVLIGLMSILGFYFPPETGEKVTLEITILVACVFFLNIVSDMQPPSSNIPLISTYFTCVLIMVACSVVATIFVLNLHHRVAIKGPMPYLIRKMFIKWLPWLLRMAPHAKSLPNDSSRLDKKIKELSKTDCRQPPLPTNILDMDDNIDCFLRRDSRHLSLEPTPNSIGNFETLKYNNDRFISSPYHHQRHNHRQITPDVDYPHSMCNYVHNSNSCSHRIVTNSFEKELQDILREVRVITDKIRHEEAVSAIEEEWRFAARVLDRFCLATFSIFFLLLSLGICLSAPHLIVS